MALARPSLTMQLTSSVSSHVLGQNADSSSNYCDNIQLCGKRRFSFCQKWHNFWLFLL